MYLIPWYARSSVLAYRHISRYVIGLSLLPQRHTLRGGLVGRLAARSRFLTELRLTSVRVSLVSPGEATIPRFF